MDNYSAIRELLKRISGQDNTFTIPKLYVEYTGDLTTAVLLNQIVFYSDKSKRTDGFFYKSYPEWEKEVCLSEKQVRRSTNKLKDFGVVETKLLKANGAPTLHYRLDYDKLAESILTFCQNPFLPIGSNDSDLLSETLTEITTETTTENTTDIKKNSRKQVFDDDSDEMKLATFFVSEIKKNSEGFKLPNLQSWCEELRKIIELDKRDKSEIAKLIRWVQQDDFEKANVLSPVKLRKRYDALKIKMLNPPKSKGPREEKVPDWFYKNEPAVDVQKNPEIEAERQRLIKELRG